MLGLHEEFLPASKRYMNDYIQYVTSDFLAGLGFGATQMLGKMRGFMLARYWTQCLSETCSCQSRG